MSVNSYSVMSFGSTNRGDNDEYSDNDLLIVTPNSSNFDHEVYSEYLGRGYSISHYNYEKLEYLAENGNLFIMHLQKWGRVIQDDTGKLMHILNSFVLKQSYADDYVNALRASNILRVLPQNEIAGGWICDVLYVTVKNILVFKSAIDQTYIFGYKSLLNTYAQLFDLNAEDKIYLERVRILKRLYRKHLHFFSVEMDTILKAMTAAEKICGRLGVEFVSCDDFSIYVKNIIGTENGGGYQGMRLVEGLYNCYGSRISVLTTVFSSPQFYIYQAKKKDKLEYWFNLIQDRNGSPFTAPVVNRGGVG